MLTILPRLKTSVILLASRAIYSCIPRKRAIQYCYLYRALCVTILKRNSSSFSEANHDREWLSAAFFSVYRVFGVCAYVDQSSSGKLQVTEYSAGNNVSEHAQIYDDNIVAIQVTKRVEYKILIWPPKALCK